MNDDPSRPPSGVSRRSVAKGIAWSVPAVAVASAAPALAASGAAPVPTFISACKYPGNSCSTRPKGYSLYFQIANPTSKTIYVYTVSIANLSGSALSFQFSVPPVPITVPANGSVSTEFVASSGNSAQQGFSADITITWGHNPTPPDPDNHPAITTRVNVVDTPPNCPPCPD
ncbi:hypothetical protein FBY41_3843 [Humibacillus xanthopallidus]|uniref:Uncharacterized protein n=1 Tax=Humibacillus xanthopallidus TaxID=412689 RepID=A0A543HJG8_9MICO|nr:hypothetical protein FBY41_3843 [Humibacillus xanthopallidus]